MMNPIIKLSDNAAQRIKEIMSNAEKDSLGVRVSVKAGGCAEHFDGTWSDVGKVADGSGDEREGSGV